MSTPSNNAVTSALARQLSLSGLLVALTTSLSVIPAPVAAQEIRYDVILRGGTVLDGSGGPRFAADVAVSDGFIAWVGDLTGAVAETEVDVRGLFVTPGFVNLHSHARGSGLRVAANMLTQGVTTEILNPDGGGPLDIAGQLSGLRESGLALNIGANIGFNSVWTEVVGRDDRRATPVEIERMRGLLVEGLTMGAWGVSAGLDYKPAYFATTDEVVEIVSAAGAWRTDFTNHDRLTPESNFSSRVGVAETLEIARRAGLVPIVTHMKAQGHEQGVAPELIDLIVASAAPGSVAAADVYPYLAGQSGLGALLIPGWALAGGREAMLRRFADAESRERIIGEVHAAMTARFGGPEGVFVTGLDVELTELMRDMGGVSPGEAVLRTLAESNRGAILRFGSDADLVAILQGPTTSVACDCGATDGRASHPRFFGSYPRVLGRYVREQGHLTWEDAIRKMTGLPATTIGMVDRGFLVPGMAADLTVFDPETVIDHATFENPTAPSTGIVHVLVNGRFALRDGSPTGETAGRALVRTGRLPSRAMSHDIARSVRAEGEMRAGGTPTGVSVSIEIQQAAGARAARGSFRLTDESSGLSIETEQFGVLQVARGWASLSGVAVVEGMVRPLLVILEETDPSADGGSTVSVRLGDDYIVSGALPTVAITARR
jgi:N-acyl-D-aspartate/D-glutamate deacylase